MQLDNATWHFETNKEAIFQYFMANSSNRQFHLFMANVCRIRADILEPIHLKGLRYLERYLDGKLSEKSLRKIIVKLSKFRPDSIRFELYILILKTIRPCLSKEFENSDRFITPFHYSVNHINFARTVAKNFDGETPFPNLIPLLKEVYGNPFCKLELPNLAWNDKTIIKLAQTIYDKRAFEKMPVLADALEEAGCTDSEVLNHARSDVHKRGCWLLDTILGKEIHSSKKNKS